MNVRAIAILSAVLAASANADGVRLSEKFGYDKDDSTRFIQAALDSDEPVIVIDRKPTPWFATPLVCRKPKTIRFEDGAWLVAKRGEFKGAGDTLLTFSECDGVKILGAGPDRCGLRMWRDDYMNTNLYATSEHRTGLAIRSCANVLVECVSKRSSEELMGRTSQNKSCVFPAAGHKPGDTVTVRVLSCTSATLRCEIVEN